MLAITRANRKIYLTLGDALNDGHRVLLEGLLRQPTGSTSSTLAWLRQPPGAPSAKHLLEHLQRLKTIEALDLSEGLQLQIHQNRWLKLAREGGQMTVQHLCEPVFPLARSCANRSCLGFSKIGMPALLPLFT
jgi:hypothetical protein